MKGKKHMFKVVKRNPNDALLVKQNLSGSVCHICNEPIPRRGICLQISGVTVEDFVYCLDCSEHLELEYDCIRR